MNRPIPAPWLANPPSQTAKMRIGSLRNSIAIIEQNMPQPCPHYGRNNDIDCERVNFLSSPPITFVDEIHNLLAQ